MKKFGFFRRLIALTSAVCMMAGLLAMFPLPAVADTESTYENPAINPETNTYNFDENIILSIFWPPTPDYVTDEQYKLIADAGVNWVMGAGEETLSNPEMQAAMLELCAKYGLGMTVSDGNFGDAVKNQSAEKIAENVQKYKDVPGAYGFYIKDEPFNPNEYVKAYLALKAANPDAYMHLNFLPAHAYGSQDVYYDQMNDWCVLCAEGGCPVDYLIFDNYPFPLSGEMSRQGFLENLRTCHDVALKNNVRTGTYIQTVCQEIAFRRPSDSEIRYEMYLSLAFGYKQLSFFTWFTPVNRSEPFRDGIISSTGVPNAHYETVKTLNHEILNIGGILAKCEAYEIYLNGQTWGQPSIPEDFFAQPADNKNYTVSFLRHKQNGANYLMVVNNDYNAAQSITLTMDEAITSLSEVSRQNGSLIPLTMKGHNVTIDLAAGDAMLIALPEGYDHYVPDFTENPAPGVNLAALPEASVSATTSLGGSGWYIQNLTDGKRMSTEGWATSTQEEGRITIDLGAVRKVNRVDVYPTGSIADYGATFPESFDVLVSADGESYTKVAEVKDFQVDDTGKSVTFDLTDARYVRIALPSLSKSVTIAEIEVYHDDGSMGKMPSMMDMFVSNGPADYNEGDNIALKKTTYVSSTTPDATYKQWGWSQEYINDGVKGEGNGFTSGVGRNPTPNSTEYVIVDFGDLFALEMVSITPCGKFPEDYQVQVSTDGKTWTDIFSVTGAQIPTEDVVITPEGGTIPARFLKFMGTKLRGGGADGYLLQFSEIEAYGRPISDKLLTMTGSASTAFKYLGHVDWINGVQYDLNGYRNNADNTAAPAVVNGLTIGTDRKIVLSGWALVNGGQDKYFWSLDGQNWTQFAGGAYAATAGAHAIHADLYADADVTSVKHENGIFTDIVADLSAYAGQTVTVYVAVRATEEHNGALPLCHFLTLQNLAIPANAEPEVTTPEPEVTTPEPEVTTPEPEVTTPEPEVTTPEPEVTTTEPEVTTTEPEVTTTEPEVTTTVPAEGDSSVDTTEDASAETEADTEAEADTESLTDASTAGTSADTAQAGTEGETATDAGGCSSALSAGMFLVFVAPAFLLHVITKKERTSKSS